MIRKPRPPKIFNALANQIALKRYAQLRDNFFTFDIHHYDVLDWKQKRGYWRTESIASDEPGELNLCDTRRNWQGPEYERPWQQSRRYWRRGRTGFTIRRAVITPVSLDLHQPVRIPYDGGTPVAGDGVALMSAEHPPSSAFIHRHHPSRRVFHSRTARTTSLAPTRRPRRYGGPRGGTGPALISSR